jgi:hypothetical protein
MKPPPISANRMSGVMKIPCGRLTWRMGPQLGNKQDLPLGPLRPDIQEPVVCGRADTTSLIPH